MVMTIGFVDINYDFCELESIAESGCYQTTDWWQKILDADLVDAMTMQYIDEIPDDVARIFEDAINEGVVEVTEILGFPNPITVDIGDADPDDEDTIEFVTNKLYTLFGRSINYWEYANERSV